MDAKDLRIETALGERNDGSKYSQSGVALQYHRNKSYQDIGSNPLAKAEATVRPCAVIGPDRVVPPPASNDAYQKKASVDLWPSPDNLYSRPPEYSHKPLNNVNPTRNISPRQTFQEDMQRIMVPPTYSAVKLTDESNFNHVHDLNAAFPKNKQTLAPEAKYSDVPYAVNLLPNEHKNVRETEMCLPSVNSSLTGTTPNGWPPSGVNLHTPRAYGTHDVYQYPQYPSCAGPRPTVMPLARPHRTYQEEVGYVYADSYYQDGSVRFKPYPSVKERYPQARYDYINNYPNPFHPPPPYVQHKYDIPSTRPHPYPVYPHMKYLDNRVPDANIEGYQRANQQSINYNMQFRNQGIHPTYAPAQGNTLSKVPYQPDTLVKSSNKLSFDNNKAFVDYENAKAKNSLPDSYFVNEMARVHQVQKPVAIANYMSPGIHPAPMQQYHRKDNMPLKAYEFKPHYRHFEHSVGFNPSGHHSPQFSPSTLAISPTDSNTSTSQEDCGYVSQSSATSFRSVDSGISNRLHNEYYRRYDYRYRPPIGNPKILQKSDSNPINSKENNKIDVRQFLSMWSEGDEDNSTNTNSKEISPKIADPNNYLRSHESAKSQDQLYVLGLVNVPNEELAKYEHIQKVSKLPENIKGYNSIELLNQFEEVIESSNMKSFKSSTSPDFFMRDRKNALKQFVEALPRPVSPLDVEAKISQSVIHKEVGCNFEIKPCSPKMLNVEIAAPVQNILGERAIEKISNPLSNKSKSPLSMRIDRNTACNQIQRQESIHTTYENPSCKMIGSPFTTNSMESVKTNYSLQDLETSSGVCLASLPRLDNEIELNFPEVNQQFINANKGESNLLDKHSQELTEDDIKLTTSSDNDKTKYDSEKYINTSVKQGSGTELTKLSQYRKSKINNSENESNANAIRTDSVIIENPENVRRIEENKEKVSLHGTLDEEENTPINLTSQGSSREECNATNSLKQETQLMECALDFSLSKSDEGLPIIHANEDELIKKDVSNEPDKSIIVKNDADYLSHVEQNAASLENPEKMDKNITKQEEINLTCDNTVKKIGEIDLDKNKINSVDKSTSTNVIVKHKHKNKHKRSTAKTNLMETYFDQQLQPEINQNGVGSLNNKNNLKRKEETNSLGNFVIHESSSHVDDAKRFKQEPNNTKTVIHNILSKEYEQIEVAVSNICKAEVNKTKSATKNLNHNNMLSESDNFEEKYSNDEEMVQNCAKLCNSPAAKVHISEKKQVIQSISVNDEKLNDTTRLICEKGEVFESNVEIGQANKYYNDLISESELFVDKTFCMDAVNHSPSNSFVHEEIAFADISTDRDFDRVEKKSDKKTFKSTNDQVLDDSKNVPDFATIRHQDNCHKDLMSVKNIKSRIDNDELNNVVSRNSAEVIASECVEGKENYTITDCETTKIINFPSDETDIVERSIGIDGIEHQSKVPVLPDAGLLVDIKCSIDSGYQSNKNSFAKNDENIVEVPKDCVFVDKDAESNQITPDSCVENVDEIEIPPKTSQSSDLYDSVDAKMQILFEQPVEEIIPENLNMDMVVNANICDTNFNLENEKNSNELDLAPKILYSNKYVGVDAVEQILLNNQKELNLTEDIQVDFNIDDACKENEILDSIFDVQTKVEISINALNHSDQNENAYNTLTNSVEMDETCAKSLKEDESDTQVSNTWHIKKISDYRGKELYSPWIQKLMFHNEGKIFKIQCLENICKTELQSDDVTSLRKSKIDNIINAATPQNTGYNVNSEGKKEFIQDVDLRIDIKCEPINSESNTKNSIESCNEESSLDFSSSMGATNNNFDVILSHENTLKVNTCESHLTEKENKPESENDCIEECDVQNDLIDTQEISFSYPNNSIISENIFNTNNSMLQFKCEDNNYNDDIKCGITNIDSSPINDSRSLKRSFSDSALNTHVNRDNRNLQGIANMHNAWPPKRNKVSEFDNFMPNNRRNSVNIEENVSFCILIDDNCIITEENEEKICIAELQEDFITEIDVGNDDDNNRSFKELYCSSHGPNVVGSEILESEEVNPVHESWVEDIGCVETVYNDEVAENVVISAPSSPTDSESKYEHDESDINSDGSTSCHIDKVKFMHEEKMAYEDEEVLDTLYRTSHMDIMNKTLLYGDKNVELDNTLTDPHQENILLESDDWKTSPTHTADYIDSAQASNDFRLETPENKENMFVKELSPLRRIDDYLDVSSAENETDEQTLPHVLKLDKKEQDSPVHSCESSLDNVFDYKLKDESISTITSTSYMTSSSPEVSSTTSEEKNSSILLKITNLNGSRVSQINEIETNNRPRCKFTEKKEYSTSNLNFPNRPLVTKAAQKYIPPIKESIRDLKVKISLPQQSLLKLKQLKLSRSEQKGRKQHNVIPIIAKKPKPNFDDVLKSIDEIQIKRHKEKSKKTKTVVPKVVIKKNGNGSHYASTPKKDMFNPDLTGRKWQPWVFLEKNHFIDKMAIKNKTRAIYSYRKKNYVLAEKFKKYKSVSSTKFIISQPKTPGQLKYTIRLKHTY